MAINEITDLTEIGTVKVYMLKGEKGDSGGDETEIRNELEAEILARKRNDIAFADSINDMQNKLDESTTEVTNMSAEIAVERARIDNIVSHGNVQEVETTIWTGTAQGTGGTISLSDPVSDFDYLDIYTWKQGDKPIFTVPAVETASGADPISLEFPNVADSLNNTYMWVGEIQITIESQAINIARQFSWQWTGAPSASATWAEISNGSSLVQYEPYIYKVVGRKVITNEEVEDIRIGANGETYNSAGTAVREQIRPLQELTEMRYSENLIIHKNFYTKTAGSTTRVVDSEGITITNTGTSNYTALSTYNGYIEEQLTVGKRYRLHAKAEVVSGSPYLYVAVRGVSGNENTIVTGIYLGTVHEGYVDFTMTEYMKKISLFMSWTSSTKNSVARYSEIWVQEILGNTDIDTYSREQISKINQTNAYSFSLPRCFFWGKTTVSGGSLINGDQSAVSEPFKLKGNARIVLSNTNGYIRLYNEDSSHYEGRYGNEMIAYANRTYRLIITTADGTNFDAQLIDDTVFYTDHETYQQYLNDYRIKVEYSMRARPFSASTFDSLFNGDYYQETSTLLGVRIQYGTSASHRATKMPVYCDNDLYIAVGQYGTHTVKLYLNNDNTPSGTYSNGAIIKIPAKTEFRLAITSTNTGEDLGKCIIFINTGDNDKKASGVGYQLLNGTGYQTMDSFVVTDSGKRILLSRKEQGYYTVVDTDGTVLTNKANFDHNTEHCNSANYLDGKVYVSSFYGNPDEIFVFDFDEETNLLTYEKTITVNLPTGNSYTQYHVLKDEEQIIGLGWNDTTGIYSGAWIRYSLFCKKDDGSYYESLGVNLPWYRIYQSMCLYNNELYVVECKEPEESYYFKTIRKVDLGSFICGKSKLTPTGSIATNEVEGIYPLSRYVFLLCDRSGSFYIGGYKE